MEEQALKKKLTAKYQALGEAKIPKHEIIAAKRRDFTPFTNPLSAQQLVSLCEGVRCGKERAGRGERASERVIRTLRRE